MQQIQTKGHLICILKFTHYDNNNRSNYYYSYHNGESFLLIIPQTNKNLTLLKLFILLCISWVITQTKEVAYQSHQVAVSTLHGGMKTSEPNLCGGSTFTLDSYQFFKHSYFIHWISLICMMMSKSKQGEGVSTMKDLLQVDAVIVGRGPCGLALAKGLLDLKYKVIVIEKKLQTTTLMSHDWSKSYSYKLDVCGLALLEKIGLQETLINSKESTKSEGLCTSIWKTDGTLQGKPAHFVLGSIGYWMICPKLMKLLHDHVLINSKFREKSNPFALKMGWLPFKC